MRVALVFPPFYLEPMYNMPPLGLIHLATNLAADGHDPCILDFPLDIRRGRLHLGKRIYADCASRILEEDPGMVGFSVQCTTFPGAVRIAQLVKAQNPGIKIVFGGHSASAVDIETLEAFPWIDAVVRGEGEITMSELTLRCVRAEELHGVRGLSFRDGGRVFRNGDRELIADLDELPLADYSFVPPFSTYRDSCGIPRSIAILEVGRGCPHHCIYCSQSVMWRRRQRTYSVPRLIREMRDLRDRFGAECFLLAYDQFTARRSFVEQFCGSLIETGLNRVPWYCISRLDTVDAELLRLMREAGCESMCYGIDSGSKRTLAFIRKNIDGDILLRRVRETTDQSIVPTLSFVIGFPEEEREDIDATLELALRTGVQGGINPLLQLATVLPGTDLFQGYADRLVRSVDTYFSLGIEFDGARRLRSDDELIDAHPAIFCSFYNLPCPAFPLETLNVLAVGFPLIVNFYPRSFLLLMLEAGESPSGLFFRFMDWLAQTGRKTDSTLAPRDCYNHFAAFAVETVAALDHLERRYLPEMIRYETMALEAGKFDSADTAFFMDLSGIGDLKPLLARNIVLGEFTFNLPDIILDIKDGVLDKTYSPSRTFMVFSHRANELDVKEINDFGMDLLRRCDGTTTVADISRDLFAAYGKESTHEAFFDLCVDAIRELAELNLVQPGSPHHLPERG